MLILKNLCDLQPGCEGTIKKIHSNGAMRQRLLDMGIEYVIISLGSDGMIAIHENDCLLCTVPEVDAIDTVGCGDALIAGFLVAQLRNFSFMEACRMGISCGTSNAMHIGPGIVDKDEVWHLMEEVNIEAV